MPPFRRNQIQYLILIVQLGLIIEIQASKAMNQLSPHKDDHRKERGLPRFRAGLRRLKIEPAQGIVSRAAARQDSALAIEAPQFNHGIGNGSAFPVQDTPGYCNCPALRICGKILADGILEVITVLQRSQAVSKERSDGLGRCRQIIFLSHNLPVLLARCGSRASKNDVESIAQGKIRFRQAQIETRNQQTSGLLRHAFEYGIVRQ